ncbi:MAG: hypothetical protein AAF228_03215 [Pseudomonadota bacterium]
MRIRLALMCLFIVALGHASYAVEYCPVKVIAVSKLDCSKGLTYIGPLNKYKFGGYCIYPLQKCLDKVEFSSSPNCTANAGTSSGNGKYVGARKANSFGGQCLYPAQGWKVETRQVSDIKACQTPEIYLGPAQAKALGGHCVKIFK